MSKQQISSALQNNGISLRERYEKRQEEEVVVERKPMITLLTIFNIIRMFICCILAMVGIITVLSPELREILINLFQAFLMEAGFVN